MLKKSLSILLLVASVLLVFPLAVSAQQGQPPAQALFYGGGYGRRGGGSWMGGGISLVEAMAEATGLSVEDVVAALQGGQSYADIASGAGVTLQAIVDVVVAERAEALAEAVALAVRGCRVDAAGCVGEPARITIPKPARSSNWH